MHEPGPDLYRVLGVSANATAVDITRAYRRQARAVHPDTAPPEAGATARFRAVAEAYQVLSDPARRAGYDRARSRPATPGHGSSMPDRGRPGPPAGMPSAWPPAPAGPSPVRTPALWAGPVQVDPLPAAAPAFGTQAESQPGAAARAGLLLWYLSGRWDGLW
jgi:curved DNA-binding protein CbpA